MTISNLLSSQGVQKIECPNLYQDLNVLLAELVGWQNLNVENDVVLVSQDHQKPQKFDFFDDKVIFPIAKKYHKKANKINEVEWVCEYSTKDKKTMMVVSQQEELSLAMALVLEFCI
jgi:hypothetical protein